MVLWGDKKHVREDIVEVGMLKTHTMCFPKSMACEQKELGVLCGEDYRRRVLIPLPELRLSPPGSAVHGGVDGFHLNPSSFLLVIFCAFLRFYSVMG